MKEYRKYAITLSIAGLLLILTGVTYSFFNYTRTGAINNLGTGRIYFNSSQSDTLNITNIFPMTSTEAGNANLDAVTISITGDTTYTDGEEFEISLVDVNNTINGKKVPINYIATYTAATGGTIGTSNSDYWEERNDKDASIYTLNSTGSVREGKQVLVGYIDNGTTGINGTLTIKAYVDADRIAISDTYPTGEKYVLNTSMTSTEINDCVTLLTSLGFNNYLVEGESLSAFCTGTGTIDGLTFQEVLDNEFFPSEGISYLFEHNMIEYLGTNGTTREWLRGRIVLTTSEWNSLASNPISFKIRAESNEGIWIETPLTMDEMCPDCKFMYYVVDFSIGQSPLLTTWNMSGYDVVNSESLPETPSVITEGLYDDYEELISTTGKNYFLGVKLNSSNQVTNAYACGVKGNVPFCIEGTLYSGLGGTQNEAIYATKKTLLQGSSLYNNTCTVQTENAGTPHEYENIRCGPWDNSSSLSVSANSNGDVYTGVSFFDVNCMVNSLGSFGCYESVGGEPDPGGESGSS